MHVGGAVSFAVPKCDVIWFGKVRMNENAINSTRSVWTNKILSRDDMELHGMRHYNLKKPWPMKRIEKQHLFAHM